MSSMRINAFLYESPMFAVSRTARRFDALANRALAPDDLSFLEGLILAAIFFEAPRRIKPSELAETFGTTRANISHTVSALESKGLLHRAIDPTDARAYLLALKPSGRKSALRVIRAFDKLQATFEREVGKRSLTEATRIIQSLEQLADSL
ncbi:MAG TPA: MarR family transcriptional regulator [Acidobacteriaceae bacterium]